MQLGGYDMDFNGKKLYKRFWRSAGGKSEKSRLVGEIFAVICRGLFYFDNDCR